MQIRPISSLNRDFPAVDVALLVIKNQSISRVSNDPTCCDNNPNADHQNVQTWKLDYHTFLALRGYRKKNWCDKIQNTDKERTKLGLP